MNTDNRNDDNKNLYYLHELSDYKVDDDYPDVRGWEVKDANKRTIGKVDELLVNKAAKRVVYLDVEVDEDIIEEGHNTSQTSAKEGVHEFKNEDGENHIIIPIGSAQLNEDDEFVYTNEIDYTTFANTRRFRKGANLDRDYELIIFSNFFPDNKWENSSNADNAEFYNRKEFRNTQ